MPQFIDLTRFLDAQADNYAAAYLTNPVLGARLREVAQALLALAGSNGTSSMGRPDDVKLRSSMTLFAAVPGADPVLRRC